MKTWIVAASLALLTCAMPAGAQTAAISSVAGGSSGVPSNPNSLYGWLFTPQTNLDVSSLGVFSSGHANTQAHQVGIWQGQTLVASTTVQPTGSVAGTYTYAGVSQFTLSAGVQYSIGAYYYDTSMGQTSSADYITLLADSVTTAPQVRYDGSASMFGSFTAPYGPATSNSYFGPNFQFAVAPEPASWALMILGFGLAGVSLRRRGTMVSELASA